MEARTRRETANGKNLLLLVMLRWLAVGGQIGTILIVTVGLGIDLPMTPMLLVVLFLVALNLVSLLRSRAKAPISNGELFAELILDVAALTVQLYLSGGAMNPFTWLFLLQVILGAVLLPRVSIWILVAFTSLCFLGLTRFYRPLDLSAPEHGHGILGGIDLQVAGMFICFMLAAVLLVMFLTRVTRNLRDQDRRLSELRQQSSEEELIVRMGLLASGAAHELGTPMATLSVILNDWERMPALQDELGSEIGEMQMALARCKDIVSRILLAAGEARGEDFERTTLGEFIDDVVAEWREARAPARLDYVSEIGAEPVIASDTAIRQILLNVFENALEASPDWVGIEARRRGDVLVITVRDRGPGFAPEILANFGKPYQSTKKRAGSGLGLFLVANVLRKLGGSVVARNNDGPGATVELSLPIGALAIEDERTHAAE